MQKLLSVQSSTMGRKRGPCCVNKTLHFHSKMLGHQVKMFISMYNNSPCLQSTCGYQNVGMGHCNSFPTQFEPQLTGVLPEGIICLNTIQGIKPIFEALKVLFCLRAPKDLQSYYACGNDRVFLKQMIYTVFQLWYEISSQGKKPGSGRDCCRSCCREGQK